MMMTVIIIIIILIIMIAIIIILSVQPHSGLGDPGLGQSDVIQQTLQQYFNVDMQQSHEGDRKDGNGGGDRNHHVSVLPAILEKPLST